MPEATLAFRRDNGRLGGHRIDLNGTLIVTGAITRTGVYTYRHVDKDGKTYTTRELRHPDDVYAADSVASFTQVPVTDNHPPPGRITPENVKQYAVGNLGDTITRGDDDRVMADLIIRDATTIAKVRDDGKHELSCGYQARVIAEVGMYQGEHYDHRQKDIRGNHVAIVDEGRGGSEVKMLLDSADAEQLLDPDGHAFMADGMDDISQAEGDGKAAKKRKGAKAEGDEEGNHKGAKGTRGGKIIGHTKSGKPVYQNHRHPGHNKFSAAEHKDSSDMHRERLGNDAGIIGFRSRDSMRAMNHHDDEHRRLRRGGDRSGNSIGKTGSGKDIFDEHNHPNHATFNLGEHEDAAKLHESKFHQAQADRIKSEVDGVDNPSAGSKWGKADAAMRLHGQAQQHHIEEASRQRQYNLDSVDGLIHKTTTPGKVVHLLRPAGRGA